MITFEFKTIKPDTYQILIRDDGKLVEVMERFDPDGERNAKIGLFSFVQPCRKSFDNADIDRFLFL